MQETITQGTTPTFSFTLPLEAAQLKNFFVTFRQSGKNMLEKRISDCVKSEYTVSTTLSQKETFLFSTDQGVQMQVRLSDKAGNAFASPVFPLRVAPILKGGEVI